MSDDSKFCMNCGQKNENIKVGICPECHKEISSTTIFCPECGMRIKKSKKSVIIGFIAISIVVIVCIFGFMIQSKSQKSPIEGVSQNIYDQGMEYIELMETSTVKNKVISSAKKMDDIPMKDIYLKIDEVNFEIDLGKNPTIEEKYYGQIISKFWQSWVICYTQESTIEDDNEDIKMVTAMFKGVVADFKEKIGEAKEKLKKSKNYKDMEETYEILDDIWKGDE